MSASYTFPIVMASLAAGLLFFVFGVILGSVETLERYDTPLTACAKDHNVYKCKWVAVPVTETAK